MGAFGKAGGADTICILLKDVDPTGEKLYLSDQFLGIYLVYIVFVHLVYCIQIIWIFSLLDYNYQNKEILGYLYFSSDPIKH